MSSAKVLRFTNQVALVTGGSRGIGFGIAKRLGDEGAKVVIVDKDKQGLDKSIENLTKDSITCLGIESDVTNVDNVQKAVQTAIDAFGQIDVLVNSAGITGITNVKTHQVDINNFDTVMKVNLYGTFNFCHAVLPHMLNKNYGRIINIASISGKEGNAGMLAYSTSKAAVIGLTKVIGKEYAETGITCNAIAPAVIQTPLLDGIPEEQIRYMTDKIPMKRTGKINELSALVAFVASKEASFVTGFTYDLSGGRATY